MPTGIGGEVAWWCPSLDDSGNGTTTLNDLTGNGYNGTLTNMDAATDWVADTDSGGVRALDFDGSNDHVNLPETTLASLSTWSISCWLNSTDRSGNRSVFGDSLASFSCAPTIRYNALRYQVFAGNGTSFFINTIDTSSNAIANAWEHLVLAFNGTTFSLFRNGSLTHSIAATGTLAALSTDLRIGGGSSGSAVAFRGRVDDVRVFNTHITTDQITALASQRGYQPQSSLLKIMQAHHHWNNGRGV
jgi:hypothetical protein